jgi:hypothetical protein
MPGGVVNSILHLQRTVGNQAVQRLLQAHTANVEGDSATVKTKLTVNTPGDTYEQEADRIADQVMATPSRSAASNAPPRIQRFLGQPNGQIDAAPASVEQTLASAGRPAGGVIGE